MPKTTASRRRPNMELVALRINAGLSREQLGYKLGLGRETIRMAEAGFVPTARVQFTIAREFGRLPLDLWPIEDQRRPMAPKRRMAVAA